MPLRTLLGVHSNFGGIQFRSYGGTLWPCRVMTISYKVADMITHLHLKSSSSHGQPPLVVETPPSITIFVGPNNSGKSQALREIYTYCIQGENHSFSILDKLSFKGNDQAIAAAEFTAMKIASASGEHVPQGHSKVKIGDRFAMLPDEDYVHARTRPNEYTIQFAQWHLQHRTLNLDGSNRILLLNAQERGDLKYPTTAFARLLTNNEKRTALRKIIHDALGLYLAIDMSEGSKLNIKFGETPPPEERSVKDDILEYMRNARAFSAVSDGVKAYTGILVQLYAGDPEIIIIDEPEAFLHPSLALNLGKEIAKGAATQNKHVFVSTHSAQFVMGAILSGATVNIIRLTYEGGVGTARLLPSTELTKLMQDPLLRSVGVLAGLFYNYVIVGEADSDRAFYQEINERLLAADDSRGIQHVLFLNADNKQTIPRITEPLRKLGIPAAGIVDIDIIKDGGQEWTRQLGACNIPSSEYPSFATRRKNVLDFFAAKDPNFKTKGGIALLSGTEHEAASNLFDDLARYGLFAVRGGEVEQWLPSLSIARTKQTWLRSIFEKMGSDPRSADYVKPASGDVWDFIGQIRTWLVAPSRRGIPK